MNRASLSSSRAFARSVACWFALTLAVLGGLILVRRATGLVAAPLDTQRVEAARSNYGLMECLKEGLRAEVPIGARVSVRGDRDLVHQASALLTEWARPVPSERADVQVFVRTLRGGSLTESCELMVEPAGGARE